MFRQFGTDKDVKRVEYFIKRLMVGLEDIFFWDIETNVDTVDLLIGSKEYPELRTRTQFLAVFTDSIDFEATIRGRIEEMIQLLLKQNEERRLYIGNRINGRIFKEPRKYIPLSKRKQTTEEFISKEKLPPLPKEELEVEILTIKEGTWGKRTYYNKIKGVPTFLESER